MVPASTLEGTMHISRIVLTPLDDRAPGRGGVRAGLAIGVALVLGLAAAVWQASMQLGPGAGCFNDPAGVCEPF